MHPTTVLDFHVAFTFTMLKTGASDFPRRIIGSVASLGGGVGPQAGRGN